MRLKGKNVLVVGLGRSGEAAVRFLLSQGARVAATDQKREQEMTAFLQKPEASQIELHLGKTSHEIFEKRDLICLSPGVPLTHPGLVRARRKKVPILGEMGLAALYLARPLVAVTGTNGKSTTSTLIAFLLKSAGQSVALAGNIGTPLLEVVMEGKRYDRIVVEVSSFQLETVQKFRPEITVLLNVTEDHLDRYPSFKDYVRAKMRILRDQTSRDWVVYNQDDPTLLPYLRKSRARKVPFSRTRHPAEGLFYHSGGVARRWKTVFEDYPLEKVPLTGLHNVENIMASIGAARLCEVSPESIRKSLIAFEGLPHRMQLVRELRGVRYYDDSKGTNVDAVLKSIAGFGDRKVLLIAGGRDKKSHFSRLRSVVSQKVKKLLLIGEASHKIAEALKGSAEIEEVGTLQAAIEKAAQIARSGDAVVLSPACASFDQFKNYEDRGDQFKEFVGKVS